MTDRLQWMLNAAVRLALVTCKFHWCLSSLLHNGLHWLDVPENISYKLNVAVHRCLQEKVPGFLIDCCTPTFGSCRLSTPVLSQLTTSYCAALATFGCPAFLVAVPTSWNSLLDCLHDSTLSSNSLWTTLNRVICELINKPSIVEILYDSAL